MNSITTYAHCLVRWDITAIGTKKEIVDKLVKYGFDEFNRLYFTVTGYERQTLHSYSEEWNLEEKFIDAINVIFLKLLSDYGFIHFRKLAF